MLSDTNVIVLNISNYRSATLKHKIISVIISQGNKDVSSLQTIKKHSYLYFITSAIGRPRTGRSREVKVSISLPSSMTIAFGLSVAVQ